MKKVFYILSFLLILIATGNAQWEWQNPLPQGNRLEQVLFFDENYGWMLTNAGTLLRTTDGGSNWNEEIIGKLYSQKIHFIDKFNGWCVGSGAPPFIMRTQDGGKTWFDLSIPDERNDGYYYNFWDVFFIDTLKGYFLDSRGAIFHTSDGGQSWIKQFQNNPPRDLESIYFLDSLKGFAAGYDPLKRTDNGGELWYADSSVIFPFGDDPRKIQFVDNLYGWIMSTKAVFRTTDGGDIWTEFAIDSNWTQNDRALDMMFIDPENGWISSGPGLYQSADSGKTWTNINPNIVLLGFHFKNEFNGWGGGVQFTGIGNKIYSTTNKGISWTTDYASITEQSLYGLDFIDENRGWAVGREGAIIHTTDGGYTWQNQSSNTTEWLRNVDFWDKEIGWSVGFGGVTLRTTNGGNSWQKINVNSDYYLEATSFVTPQNGWAVGWSWSADTAVVLHTTSGGLSWGNQTPLNSGRLFGVYFIDSLNGWIASGGGTVFDRGEVYRTTNGGESWTLQVNEPDDAFRTIIFVDSLTGWIASNNGLMKTKDGGESWIRKPAAMDNGVYDIHFVDTLKGWASGLQGRLSYTTDGGESWIKKRIQTTFTLFGIDFVNENFGWVAGDFGTLLKTETGGVTNVKDGEHSSVLPKSLNLFQNYPNPFNPMTTIQFDIPFGGNVSLRIYDVLGREVEILVNEFLTAGNYVVYFNRQNISSGVYIYSLIFNDNFQVKKMIFLK